MPLLSRLFSVWRNLAHRERVNRDLDAEVRAAFELLLEEKIRSGIPPDAARRATMVELGRVEVVTGYIRDAKAGSSVDALAQDVRYGARLLRRSPVFALTAALSLAIGIGANTTVFTVANALLLRAPAGVSESDRLLDIYRAEEGRTFANFTSSYPYYLDVRQRVTTLTGVYAYEFEPQPITLGTREGTALAFANVVTTNYFAELGVTAAMGRLFAAYDEQPPGLNPIVVLSYRLWQRNFNGDADIVGNTVQINRHPFTVVGVAARGFQGTNVAAPDLWVPMGLVEVVQPGTARLKVRHPSGLGMGGRLKPGVSRAQAAAELDAIALGLEQENRADRGERLRVARLSSFPGPVAKVAAGFFALLLGLVSVVLVIACANVAGVLLARAASRRREIAVRIALGAGRMRVVRQLLTETTLLFLLGGAAGLFLARGMTSLLLAALPAFPIPVGISLPLDGRVVAFTIAVSFVAALFSGLAPALHVTKADVVTGLKDESQGSSDRLRTRSAFVIAQVAFSIMLVVIAGLLVKALERLSSLDQGFDPRGVEVASLDLARAGYTETTGPLFTRALIDRLRALPAAEAATLSEYVPGRSGSLVRLTVPGVVPPDGQPSFTGIWNAVDRGYFTTLRIPILAGRDFGEADRPGTQPVVIISDATARQLWPGQDPIGKHISWHEASPDGRDAIVSVQVIGVARELKPTGGAPVARDRRARGTTAPGREPAPPVFTAAPLTLYVPLQQRYTPRVTILVRASGGARLASEIRELVRSLDPDLPIVSPQPLDAQNGPMQVQLRIAASVAGGVGLVGLSLAALGIYGVTAYTTARRTREIGIRMAMGAQRSAVVAMVLRQGMSLVFIGSGIGLILAAVGSRLFRRLLFGIPPIDVAVFSGAALLFAVIGLAACYAPARRATQIDAMEALRYE